MNRQPHTQPVTDEQALLDRFRQVRAASERICQPLETDDYQIQSITETSPPKWHLAHVTWFFETFVLGHFDNDYRPVDPHYAYLFNSYYETVGSMQPRPKRGLLSRPTVTQVYDYRAEVDRRVERLFGQIGDSDWPDLAARITLGLHHEQQHQELLFMDIKHNLFSNPMLAAYRSELPISGGETRPMNWTERDGGIVETGHAGDGFCFDNETPRHAVLLHPHRIADRLVTNGEYLEFIADGGYQDPALWLADGWYLLKQTQWRHPLYWINRDGDWLQYTLGGLRPLNPHEPVCHLSLYEADAYARWAGKRLPLEEEIESLLDGLPVSGNFANSDLLHPAAAEGPQWFGELWCWTGSPYRPYPGFRPLAGSMGEYNGKFMSAQFTLKGGSCVTWQDHYRNSYRNFFYPHDRWAFSGLRLAEDL